MRIDIGSRGIMVYWMEGMSRRCGCRGCIQRARFIGRGGTAHIGSLTVNWW